MATQHVRVLPMLIAFGTNDNVMLTKENRRESHAQFPAEPAFAAALSIGTKNFEQVTDLEEARLHEAAAAVVAKNLGEGWTVQDSCVKPNSLYNPKTQTCDPIEEGSDRRACLFRLQHENTDILATFDHLVAEGEVGLAVMILVQQEA